MHGMSAAPCDSLVHVRTDGWIDRIGARTSTCPSGASGAAPMSSVPVYIREGQSQTTPKKKKERKKDGQHV